MNKLNKGKKIGILACVLASFSLVGVGFSTWIINTQQGSQANGINVTVAETKNASIVISNASATDNTVKFDANDSSSKGNLITCNSGASEDLNFTLIYTVTVGTSVTSFEIKAGIDDSTNVGGGKYTQAVETYKYIELPTTLGLKKDSSDGSKACFTSSSTTSSDGLSFTSSDDTGAQTKTYVVTQKFTFSWGEAFAKKNPVEVSSSDSIYTYSTTTSKGSTANATVDTLTANTKGLNSLSLSNFNVILSIGSVSTNVAG